MSLYLIEYSIILAFLFLLGSILGSLLNVCVYRLPERETFWGALRYLVYPPSHCPRCQQRILMSDNIPILGWLKLRGRCRSCHLRISPRYPLIELLTAVLFVLLYCCEVPPDWTPSLQQSVLFHPLGPQGTPGSAWLSPVAILRWRYAFHTVLIFALLTATFIDFDLRIIPDTVTLPAMAVGVLGNWLLGQVYIVPVWFQDTTAVSYAEMYRMLFESLSGGQPLPGWLAWWFELKGAPAWVSLHPHWHGLLVSLAGILVGGGVVWAVRAVGYWALRREAMGFGDVMLMAMIGSFVGWQPVLLVFFLAPLCALLVTAVTWLSRREREIPYGPYLSLATLIMLVSWKWIWPPVEERFFALGPLLPVVAGLMLAVLGGMLKALRIVQRLMGIDPDAVEYIEEWGPADQLSYQAGENTDDQQGTWRGSQWPGVAAGRGQTQQQAWRDGSAANGWQSAWHRRPPLS